MRADQLLKMRQIQEELADVFFEEANVKKWPDLLTRDSRGDRYWMKKNASASLAIIGRIENLLALRDGRASGGGGPAAVEQERNDEASLDREIRKAEKDAAALGKAAVERIRKRAKVE